MMFTLYLYLLTGSVLFICWKLFQYKPNKPDPNVAENVIVKDEKADPNIPKFVSVKDGEICLHYPEVKFREGEPAIIHANGRHDFYKDGKLIRYEWYNHKGQLHSRLGLPSYECFDKNVLVWHNNGIIHNSNGPARIITKNGLICSDWFDNGNFCKTEIHNKDGKFREGEPAVIHANGRHEFYKDGKLVSYGVDNRTEYRNEKGLLHRTDGPAVINHVTKCKEWRQNGVLHRTDGPSFINPEGREEFHIDGKHNRTEYRNEKGVLHRTDGPAVINHVTKCKEWRQNGILHRTDGPAIVNPDECIWYINGEIHRDGDKPAYYTINEEFHNLEKWYFRGKLHRADGPAIVSEDGKSWWHDGMRHRTDGPAVDTQRSKEWFVNGVLTETRNYDEKGVCCWIKTTTQERFYVDCKLHREDGPAVIFSNGTKEWYIDGLRHREDGPAFVDDKGLEKWYLRGKLHRNCLHQCSKCSTSCNFGTGPSIVNHKTGKLQYHKFGVWLYSEYIKDGQHHREDGPAVMDRDGVQKYYNKGKLHREDGPAISGGGLPSQWYIDGLRHRKKGPAEVVNTENGTRSLYWINGVLNRIEIKNHNGQLHSHDDQPSFSNYALKRHEWHNKGKLHRIGKPAVIFEMNVFNRQKIDSFKCEFYVNGELVRTEWRKTSIAHGELGDEFTKTSVGDVEVASRLPRSFSEIGELHQTDGPAVINYVTKCKEWRQNGKLHRTDGPALVHKNGEQWYNNGVLHRLDGPAVINEKDKHWYHDGVRYRKNGLDGTGELYFNDKYTKQIGLNVSIEIGPIERT